MALVDESLQTDVAPVADRRGHWPALVGFVALAVFMTLPGLPRLFTHILGMGDAPYFVWELWSFHQALAVKHADPLVTTLLFHPTAGVPLIWSTPINLLPAVALVGGLGPVATYNVLVLAALALAGYGAYRLAWRLVGDRRAAFLAGMLFTLAPAHMAQVAYGHMGVLSVQWVPFCALALLGLYDQPRWRRAGLFALTVALVAASDLYVAAYFFGTLGLAFVGYHAVADRGRFFRPAFLFKAGAATLLGLVATLPFHLPTWRTLHGAKSDVAQAASVDRFGQDLIQLLLPAPTHRLLGGLSRPFAERIANGDSWGSLGWVALGLAAIALWRRRGALTRFWAIFTGLAVVGSLGTWLHVAGLKLAPMPYWLAAQLPGLKSFRVPGRLAEVAALGLAVLAGVGAAWLFARLGPRSRWAFGALVALIALESATFMPFPTTPALIPPFYRQLAADPAAGAILELPNGDEAWGGPTHRWMYYQTAHARPLVFGHTHRIPDGATRFYWTDPVVSRLAAMAYTGRPPALAPGTGAGRHLAGFGITHVALHQVPGMLDGALYLRLRGELVAIFGEPHYEDDGMVAFRTTPQVRPTPGR